MKKSIYLLGLLTFSFAFSFGQESGVSKKENLIQNFEAVSTKWRTLYEKSNINEEKKRESFHLVSQKRSESIAQIFQHKKVLDLKWDKNLFEDIYREVKSIPLRWMSLVKSRYQIIKEDLSDISNGWKRVAKEVLIFFGILALGIFLYSLFKQLNLKLKELRDKSRRNWYRQRRKHFGRKILEVLTSCLPWAWIIFFLKGSEEIFLNSYFKEITILFPYISYFAYYKIFKIIVDQLVSKFSFYRYDIIHALDRKKLNRSTRFIGSFFYISLMIQHALGTVGGKGLIYHFVASILPYFLIFILFYVAYTWRKEVQLLLKRFLNDNISQYATSILESRWSLFLALPLGIGSLFLLLLFNIYEFLEQYDFVRAISAQYFRKKLEVSQKNKEKENFPDLGEGYYEKFYTAPVIKDAKIFESQEVIKKKMLDHINSWVSGEADEHIALVYGEKGIGKTQLLNSLKNEFSEGQVLFHTWNDRSFQRGNLKEMISDLKKCTEKTVVFIDGLQYLFLSKRKGFDHFKDFLHKTQEESMSKIFWVIGINNYSWEFIQAVLKKNRYFNFIYKLDKWREEGIQNLILEMHRNTEMKISYDKVLFGGESDSESMDVTSRYFRILWEEAMGNPAVAIRIWLKSLKQVSDKEVRAFIPEERSEFLKELPDNFYFILAAIVRHESMTIKDITESTDLEEDVVVNAVKVCLEKGYLVKTKHGKMGINPMAQHSIYSTLKRMNFIYE